MLKKTIFSSILLFLVTGYYFTCLAQKRIGRKLTAQEVVDTVGVTANEDFFSFKNVNVIPYYNNSKELATIEKYEREKDWTQLYPVLYQYVKKFGILNFYKDTHLLWRLAKLSENLNKKEDAILLYKLVLKHHRQGSDIDKVLKGYDSLADEKQSDYVPLKYYYELVEYRKEVDTLRPPRGVLLNMGNNVNSKLSDYGPALFKNDQVLIFTSKRNINNTSINGAANEDLFFSLKINDQWTKAKPFTQINTILNEGSACLSRNGRTLYFSRCNGPDSYGSCDLYVAELQADSSWGNIKNLGASINSTSWDSHPSLSHSEDTLYFASDRLGGFGLADIWYTWKTKEGQWVQAKNAGPLINTRNNEVSPYYHPVYNILYFSSNGHILNFGQFDIYKSYKKSYGWGEPKNIGPLVNGAGNEYYFTIDSGSKDLFYAKSKPNDVENLDLFSFPLPMEAQPGATTRFRGSLTDSLTGEPFMGIVSIIDLDNGIEVAPKFLDPLEGTFNFELINNNNYLIIIQGNNFFRIEEMFFLNEDMEFHKKTQSISSKLKFQSVEFENGKSDLQPQMFADLDKIGDFLLDNPDFKLRISGHTDSDGSEDLNLKLSRARATSIKEYIVHFGKIHALRIEADGFGSSKPIIKEEITEEDKRLNRRVEFEIYRPGKDEEKEDEKKRLDQEKMWKGGTN